MNPPVITIDGPSGAGKGTVAELVAGRLGFHVLDSGAVYRAAALHALNQAADLDCESEVIRTLGDMQASFQPLAEGGVSVQLDGRDVTRELRTEQTASAASRVAAMPGVRAILLEQQRSFRVPPGLVADGRDMGTVVFPDAVLKVFLQASVQVRADRRAKQLKDKGISFTMRDLVREIGTRDERDSNRDHAPLHSASGALIVDSSDLTIIEVVDKILSALPSEINTFVV